MAMHKLFVMQKPKLSLLTSSQQRDLEWTYQGGARIVRDVKNVGSRPSSSPGQKQWSWHRLKRV